MRHCMADGLAFAVDASLIAADANKQLLLEVQRSLCKSLAASRGFHSTFESNPSHDSEIQSNVPVFGIEPI